MAEKNQLESDLVLLQTQEEERQVQRIEFPQVKFENLRNESDAEPDIIVSDCRCDDEGYHRPLKLSSPELTSEEEGFTHSKPDHRYSTLSSKKIRIEALATAIVVFLAVCVAWIFGAFTTQHTEVFSDGSEYVGEWQYHKANGDGVMTYSDGRVFSGEWKDNMRDGHGVLTFADGEQIEGTWKNDQRNGTCTYTSMTGETSDSYAQYDENERIMTIKYEDGDSYKGQWKDDLKNGEGVYVNKDGTEFVGVWKEGTLIKGAGTFLGNDGSSYVGTWENGRFLDGDGMYITRKGNCYVGECKNGEPHGTGMVTYNDGREYYGTWINGIRYGRGKFVYPDGTVVKGQWSTEHSYLFITDSGKVLDWHVTDM